MANQDYLQNKYR